jgi:hypothetical protein
MIRSGIRKEVNDVIGSLAERNDEAGELRHRG